MSKRISRRSVRESIMHKCAGLNFVHLGQTECTEYHYAPFSVLEYIDLYVGEAVDAGVLDLCTLEDFLVYMDICYPHVQRVQMVAV